MTGDEFCAELSEYDRELEVEYEAIAKRYQSWAERLMGQFDGLSVEAQAEVIVKMRFRGATLNTWVDRGNGKIRDSERALVATIVGQPVDY